MFKNFNHGNHISIGIPCQVSGVIMSMLLQQVIAKMLIPE
jgi:hypothetical protein